MLAAGTLAGTIIGAGVFALPYVVGKVGAATGLFYLCGAALAYFVVHRMYAAIVVKNEGAHDYAGLARIYLPRVPAFIASLMVVGELAFALVVYLALAPSFLALITPFSPFANAILFWALGSLFIFASLMWQGFAELAGTLFIVGIVGVVLVAGNGLPFTVPAFLPLDLPTAFLPLGALLFAFMGRSAIIPVVEEWRAAREKFSLSRAIALGTLVPLPLYAVFVFAMLRLAPSAAPEALNSIGFLPAPILFLLGLMGFITLWTSYFMIGANLKGVLHLDLKVPTWGVTLFVLAFPLAVYCIGFDTFFSVVTFTGSVLLALDGIFVVWMWLRAFPAHRFRAFAAPLVAIFFAALAYDLLSRTGLL